MSEYFKITDRNGDLEVEMQVSTDYQPLPCHAKFYWATDANPRLEPFQEFTIGHTGYQKMIIPMEKVMDATTRGYSRLTVLVNDDMEATEGIPIQNTEPNLPAEPVVQLTVSRSSWITLLFESIQNLLIAFLQACQRLSTTRTQNCVSRKDAASRLAEATADARIRQAQSLFPIWQQRWDRRMQLLRSQRDAKMDVMTERFHIWKTKWDWRISWANDLYVWYRTRRQTAAKLPGREVLRFPRLALLALVVSIAGTITFLISFLFVVRLAPLRWYSFAVATLALIAWFVLRRIVAPIPSKLKGRHTCRRNTKAFFLYLKQSQALRKFYAGLFCAILLAVTFYGLLAKATYLWTLTTWLAFISWQLYSHRRAKKIAWAEVAMPMRTTLSLGIWLICYLTRKG